MACVRDAQCDTRNYGRRETDRAFNDPPGYREVLREFAVDTFPKTHHGTRIRDTANRACACIFVRTEEDFRAKVPKFGYKLSRIPMG